MKCGNCSFDLPDDAAFCGGCGALTSAAPAAPQPPPPPVAVHPAAVAPAAAALVSETPATSVQAAVVAAPAKSNKKILVALVATVAVVAIALAAVLLSRGKSSTSAVAATTAVVAPSDSSAGTVAATTIPATTIPATTVPAALKMPSIVGLSDADAREKLADAGIQNATFTPTPQAGPSNLVLSQVPSSGSADLTTVTVEISQPVAMPDFTGQPAADTRATLIGLGAVVTVEETFDPALAPGVVISQTPASAASVVVPEEVTLQVSSAGTELFLDQVSSPTADCEMGGAKVNTYQSGHAMYCAFSYYDDPGRSAANEFDLNRSASVLRFIGGLDDSSPTSGRVRLIVYGDGIKLWEHDYGLGESTEENIPITGVLRLRLEMINLASDSDDYVYGVFADVRLAGDSAQIANVPRQT